MEDISVIVGNHLLNYRVSAIFRKGNKILLHHGLDSEHYTLPGGRVKEGETTEDAIKREIKEEMGQDVKVVKSVSFMENLFDMNEKKYHEILVTYELEFLDKNMYEKERIKAIEKDKKLEFIWFDQDKLDNITFVPTVLKTIILENPKEFKHIINNETKLKNSKYIGEIVTVKVDRQMGSKHPKHGFIYPVNYGYIPNTISGDGEELDAYILGVFETVEEFTGKCIAIIHRLNDDDDKLVIVPEGINYSDDAIKALTEFQERFFKNEIIK